MIIRKARAEDMEAALELIKELAVYEKEPDAVIVTVDDLIRDGFGVDPLFYSYVAVDDGTIVGMALYYYRYSTWKGRTLHLEDLVVKETKSPARFSNLAELFMFKSLILKGIFIKISPLFLLFYFCPIIVAIITE